MNAQSWNSGLRALGLGLATLAASATARAGDPVMTVLEDVQDGGRVVFKMVDENNDGQISQKEANDAANLIVGGFFFRADTNGDGQLSQQESRAASDSFFAERPWLKFIVGRIEYSKPAGASSAATNPKDLIMSVFDANGDKNLSATELRQGIQTSIQGLFAAADTNRDGLLSPVEVNAAAVGALRAGEQATFQAADLNHDGQISKEEFLKALTDPANAAFAILDANNDGQLSQQELASAGRIFEDQVRRSILPESSNSLKNLIQTGRTPEQQAPIPSFPVQNRPNAAPATIPPR